VNLLALLCFGGMNLAMLVMIESQLAQVVAVTGPISEKLKEVTTREGKSTRDPLHPNHAGKASAQQQEERPSAQEDTREPKKETAP